MRHRPLHILSALVLLLASPLAAQTSDAPAADGEDAAPAPAEEAAPPADGGLALGEPVPDVADIGEPYLGAEFGDWDLRCVRTEDGNDPCQLYQLLEDQNGNAVAEISVFPLPAGQQAQAGVTIITPLETLLTEQLTLRVDAGQAKRYPFTFCAPVGCVSRIGLLPEEVQGFRRGARATVRIVPAAAPDQEVILTVSLAGFTAGFQAVVDAVERVQPEN
jgi:invasion protein IalB